MMRLLQKIGVYRGNQQSHNIEYEHPPPKSLPIYSALEERVKQEINNTSKGREKQYGFGHVFNDSDKAPAKLLQSTPATKVANYILDRQPLA